GTEGALVIGELDEGYLGGRVALEWGALEAHQNLWRVRGRGSRLGGLGCPQQGLDLLEVPLDGRLPRLERFDVLAQRLNGITGLSRAREGPEQAQGRGQDQPRGELSHRSDLPVLGAHPATMTQSPPRLKSPSAGASRQKETGRPLAPRRPPPWWDIDRYCAGQ